MNALRAVWSEFIGLFIDDLGFAVSILVWLLVGGGLLPRLGVAEPWPAIALFVGLAAILIESAVRRSRQR